MTQWELYTTLNSLSAEISFRAAVVDYLDHLEELTTSDPLATRRLYGPVLMNEGKSLSGDFENTIASCQKKVTHSLLGSFAICFSLFFLLD